MSNFYNKSADSDGGIPSTIVSGRHWPLVGHKDFTISKSGGRVCFQYTIDTVTSVTHAYMQSAIYYCVIPCE